MFWWYTTKSKAFVVPYSENMRGFFAYVIRHHLIKGFRFSLVFSLSLNLNQTVLSLNQEFSSGFRQIPWTELMVWFRVWGKWALNWTELNFSITKCCTQYLHNSSVLVFTFHTVDHLFFGSCWLCLLHFSYYHCAYHGLPLGLSSLLCYHPLIMHRLWLIAVTYCDSY
jgi:hypothetical protein